jgi:hypothetical protein
LPNHTRNFGDRARTRSGHNLRALRLRKRLLVETDALRTHTCGDARGEQRAEVSRP